MEFRQGVRKYLFPYRLPLERYRRVHSQLAGVIDLGCIPVLARTLDKRIRAVLDCAAHCLARAFYKGHRVRTGRNLRIKGQRFDKHAEGILIHAVFPAAANHGNIDVPVRSIAGHRVERSRKEQRGGRYGVCAAEIVDFFPAEHAYAFAERAVLLFALQVAGNVTCVFKAFKQLVVIILRFFSLRAEQDFILLTRRVEERGAFPRRLSRFIGAPQLF